MKIAICGLGGSGKDLVAKWLGVNTVLKYRYSTSWVVADKAFSLWNQYNPEKKDLFINKHTCYYHRAYYREYWSMIVDQYNKHNAAQMYIDHLKIQDIVTGIRKFRELNACREQRLFDLIIWIDRFDFNQNRNIDTPQEFGPDACDISIMNRGTTHDLFVKLNKLSRALGIYGQCT